MNFYKCKCKNIIFLIIFTLIITQIFAVGAENLRDKSDSERFDPFLEEIYKRWKDGLPISERDEMFLNMTETEFDQYVKQREEEARSYRENIGKSEGEKELSDEERIAGIEHRAREVEMETGAYHEKQIHPEMKLTNRFIVKYKDELEDLEKKTIKLEEKGQEREKKIRDKLQKKTEKIAKVETKKVNAKKFDVLTTQEKELPNLFIQEVKEMDIEGEIEYIQPDYPMKLTSWEEEDEIDKIEFDDLVIPWESTRGAGTVTAILDTMIDVDHPDLSGKMGKGWNFVQDNDVIYTSEYSDTAEHGTHIAGVISKIAPETRILPIVVFQNGTAFTSDIIAGIEYAQNAGADIVNCSWASTMENQALKEAMAASNMLFICAAGNDGKNLEEHPVYPAAYDLENILTVGSVNSCKGCSSFSNYGPKYVDLATYGEEICAAQPGGAYSAKSGTSIAAAYTSGAAALIMGCYETSTAAEVKQRMMDTSQRVSTLTDKVKDSNLLCLKNILEENPDPAARELLFVEDTGEGIDPDLNPTGTGWTLQAESKRPMVSMKYEYGLFLKADGTVYEWENGISEIPEKVDGLDHIIQVSAGNSHGLALKADGTVWAWGTNSYGQLGNGTTSTSLTPVKVQSGGSDLTNVVAIAAGSYHSMALKSDGSIWSWGGNSSGELGDGTVTKKTTPVQISASAGSEFTKISAGSYHSMALKNDGSVWTWGSNTYGQLGNGEMGNKKNKSVPVQVKIADGEGYLSGITDISAGNNHSIALQSNGEACAWGYNVDGQLGCGNTTSSNVPVAMADESNVPITNVMQIFAGYNGTLIINANGSLWGCGDNTSKKISNVSESKLLNVQQVCDEDGSFLVDIRNAYIGGTRSTAVKNNGELWTTKIMSNQISSPKRVFIVNAEKVSTGDKHSLALKSDGSVWAWGSNEKGQLGNNSLSDSSIPVQVLNSSGDGYLSDIVDIYAGTQFSLALKSDGTVWAWGANNNGQLGNNTRQDSSLPVQVKDSNGQDYLSGVTAITSCWNSVTVVKNNGSVWLWGATMFGESLVPIAVPYVEFMSNVIKAQTNGDTILVLKDNGTVWFWQNSPYAASSEPVAIMNQNRTELLDSATDIALPDSYYGTDSAYFYILANGGNAYLLQSQYIGEQLGDESAYFENVSSISIRSTELLLVLSSGELVYYNRQSPYILPEIEYIQLQGEEFIKVTQAAVSYDHKLALAEDGTVWAWGKNDRGQLGIGPDERANSWKRWFTPGGGPVQVDSGTDYTLVRYSDGTVWAAGKNNFGQLGNGTTETSRKPIQVRNLEHIIDLQCGDNHNIALKSDGSVWTWGYNGKGQLGNGTIIDSHIPVQVQEESGAYLKDVVAIAAGVGHSVALKADGTIWVWGDNDYDQLGTSSILGSSTTAVKLEVEDEFEQKISAIAAGSYHNLALENGGHVLAWGNNGSGELGNGSNVFKISAVRNEENTGSLDGVTQIYAMDRYSMVVKSNGEVWGWGPMSMLSYMMESSNLPVRILDGQESLAGVSKIDGRSTHIFVLKENGEVLWLGEGMMDGPFWTRTETFSEVENLYEIIDIAVSENHAVALKGNGEVYFWGDNPYGQFGTDEMSNINLPLNMELEDTASIWNGYETTFILKSNGEVFSWGTNIFGELGNGTYQDYSAVPQKVEYDIEQGEIIQIRSEGTFTLFLKEDGSVWACGNNELGQIGNGYTGGTYLTPVQVKGENGSGFLQDVIAIETSGSHSAALKSDGSVWTWGDNSYGKLGNNSSEISFTPVQVKGEGGVGVLDEVIAISTANNSTLALKSDGTVWAWGCNTYGQLGDDSVTRSQTPVQVKGENGIGYLNNVVAISSGWGHSIALKSDGSVWAWGHNTYGQLGDGSTVNRPFPVQVKEESGANKLEDIVAIDAGTYHTIARTSNGTAYTWGCNTDGQLGDGTYENSTLPRKVLNEHGDDNLREITYITAGGNNCSCILEDGRIMIWGDNKYSQLLKYPYYSWSTAPILGFCPQMLVKEEDPSNRNIVQTQVSKWERGSIDYVGEINWYKFMVPYTEAYFLEVIGSVIQEILTENMEPVPWEDASCTYYNLQQGEEYYLKISSDQIQEYTFRIALFSKNSSMRIDQPVLKKGIGTDSAIIHSLQEGFIVCEMNVSNLNAKIQPVALIVSLVKKSDNKCYGVFVLQKEVGAGETEIFSAGLNIPVDYYNYKLEIMAWDSVEKMNLLSNSVIVE